MPPLPQTPPDTPQAPDKEGVEPVVSGGWPNTLKKIGHALGRRLGNFLIDFIAVALVSIAFLAFFESLSPHQDALLKFQRSLFESVQSIRPLALLDYIFSDFGDYLATPIRDIFDNTVGGISAFISSIEDMLNIDPHGFLDFLLDLLAWPVLLVLVIVEFVIMVAILALCLILSPIILPIAVLTKGSVLDGIMVLLVFVPLMVVVFRFFVLAPDLSIGLRAGLLIFGTVFALEGMTLFYFFLQYAMLGALWAFGALVPSAPTGVAASGVAVFGYECAKKTVEESIVERLAGYVRKAVGL